MAMQRKALGRYENVSSALHPGGRFLPEGKHLVGRIEIAHARLHDPAEFVGAHLQKGKFSQAMVNIARDPLEREYRYGRLSRQQHAAGMRYRSILDHAAGRGEHIEGPRAPAIDAHEYKIAKMIDAAREAVALRKEATQICGPRGEMVLTAVLGGELTFRETANKIASEPGAPKFWLAQVGVTRVAREFREALRLLAEAWFDAAPSRP